MAGILTETDAANAGTGVNLRSAAAAALNPVKFQTTAAQEFVANQNWDGLETYLSEFLTEVQGDKFHPHPGLFCSLYQAQISSLIGEKKFDEAKAIFHDKVGPLVAHRDGLYAPSDLEGRLGVLENCVFMELPLPADEVEYINVVLSDYIMLYFPTSLQSEVKRTNSFSDFLVTLNDEKGKRHRCLACRQVIPAPVTYSSIVNHIDTDQEYNYCFRVTDWMREYLAHVKGEKETDIQDLSATASSSGNQSRKRKAPSSPSPTVPDQQSLVIHRRPALSICIIDLVKTNLLAFAVLYEDESETAAKSEATEIVARQDKLITELKNLFFSFMLDSPHCSEKKMLDSPLAFSKIKTLLNLSDDLLPLLKNLPGDVSEVLLKQDKKITELRCCFMVAAAGRLNPTAPAGEMSSTASC